MHFLIKNQFARNLVLGGPPIIGNISNYEKRACVDKKTTFFAVLGISVISFAIFKIS